MAIPPIAFRVLELTFADRPVPTVRAGVPPNELPSTRELSHGEKFRFDEGQARGHSQRVLGMKRPEVPDISLAKD